jgi:glucokinase
MPAPLTIGVDMGGTKLLAGAVDSELAVLHRSQRSVAGLDQSALIDAAVDAVQEAREAVRGEVAAVGFGIPCLIDQRTGIGVLAVNLPLANIAFGDVMTERLGMPAFVDNDANLAAVAEHRAGAARGYSDAVMLTVGSRIGGGLILRNELYRGAIGAGAELGHIVIDMDGPKCQGNCPNHGCVEAMASGTALIREAARLAGERPDSGLAQALRDGRELEVPLVTELAHDGDEAAVEVVELIGQRLGVALATLVNIFNPQVIVIGGSVTAAGELLLGPARAAVAERALVPNRDEVRIVGAHFGVEAGMIGAAALAFSGLEAGTR